MNEDATHAAAETQEAKQPKPLFRATSLVKERRRRPTHKEEYALIRENLRRLEADIAGFQRWLEHEQVERHRNSDYIRDNALRIEGIERTMDALHTKSQEQISEMEEIIDILRTLRSLRRWFYGLVVFLGAGAGATYHILGTIQMSGAQ